MNVARDRVALGAKPIRGRRGANFLGAAGAGIVIGAISVFGHRFVVIAGDILPDRFVVALLNILGDWLIVAPLNVTHPCFRLGACLWARWNWNGIAGTGRTAIVATDLENIIPGGRCGAGGDEPPTKGETENRES